MENLAELVRDRCQKDAGKKAFLVKKNRKWEEVTWSEVDKKVDLIAGGLLNLGVKSGDRVSILGNTMLEWTLADLGITRIGGVSVGIYQTLSAEQCKYILSDSGSGVLFIESEQQLQKIEHHFPELPKLKTIVLWKGRVESDKVLSFEDLLSLGKQHIASEPGSIAERESKINPDNTAIIVYTSGTTGPPKGACLSHKNVLAQLNMLEKVFLEKDIGDTMMFFLPLSHVGERVGGQYMRISRGIAAAYVQDITKILEDIVEIQPTFFGSVPRVFEKAYAKIQSEVANASPLKQKLFYWAEKTGTRVSRLLQENQTIPLGLALQFRLADLLVLRKIRQIFGGKVRSFLSSSAPIAREIIEFFHACGMLIWEAYGQTELSCFCTLCTSRDYRFGSVGKALPGVDLKIAADGEIMVKGDIVFKEYLNQPELTKQTLSEDGWIYTGDLGRIDEDGYLWITGRKKDIIVTSGGKNVTPSNIEQGLMNHQLIERAIVHGDRRNYLTALISICPENVEIWGQNNGHVGLTYSAFTELEALKKEVQGIVDRTNAKLARFETIKKFALLPAPLEVETGELTPTMKTRRKIVEEKYGPLLNSLYQ